MLYLVIINHAQYYVLAIHCNFTTLYTNVVPAWSRKLAPLAPPVPDKPHLVEQNEIEMKKYWTYYGKSEEILSYIDMVIGHIVQ